MSLTSCLKKAEPFLAARDKADILRLAREYRSQGLDAAAAGAAAIDEQLAGVTAEREAMEAAQPKAVAKENASEDKTAAADNVKQSAPLDPQIQSATGNNGNFDPAKKNITLSPARPQFYSQLQRAIEGVPDRLATMAAPQWKLWLDANAAKLGVKKDEIEWSGVKDYLDMRGKDKVTREDIAGYLGENGVKIKEVVLGGVSAPMQFELPKIVQDYIDYYGGDGESATGLEDIGREASQDGERAKRQGDYAAMQEKNEIAIAAHEAAGLMRDNWSRRPETKYASYTVPGGENYREMLITLPDKPGERVSFKNWQENAESFGDISTKAEYDRLVSVGQISEPKAGYRSSHFDQPNILAHVRMDDRTDAEGNKVLFLQEIQSDWGQDGKKKGFKQAVAPETLTEKENRRMRDLQEEGRQNLSGDDLAEFNALIAKQDVRTKNNSALPSAPFVQKTEAWIGLAIKHAIMHAVENGQDKVAFITGEQAAGLYSLDKQVDELVLYDDNTVVARQDGRNVIERKFKTDDELADIVGKEVAAKLLATKRDMNSQRILRGNGLKVEASGMRQFYDTLVPQVANDVLKKLGGGKTESVGVYNSKKIGPVSSKTMQQPGFTITPAMKEKVAGGVAMFSAKRELQTETPAFKKWFGNSKVVDADNQPMVVYHGTAKSITEFSNDQGRSLSASADAQGFYFTDHPEVADGYASAAAKKSDPVGRTGAATYPVYLSLQNPDIRIASRSSPVSHTYISPAARAALEEQGFDGVIYQDPRDSYFNEYIAFNPSQIKSATGNNGEFDAGNNDISQSTIRQKLDDAINKPKVSVVGPTSRVHTPEQLAAMRRVGFEVETPSLADRAKALTQGLGKRLAQGIVDQFAPIKDLDEHAYLLTRLSKGASGAFEAMLHGGQLKLTDGVYDFDDQNKGGVVERLLQPLQGEHHDFFRWIAANRAERLLGEDKEHLFTQLDIDALKTLASGQAPYSYTLQHGPNAGQQTNERAAIYADSLKTFNAFSDNVMDLSEQSGLIDKDARHLWEQEFYVPFYRVADDMEGGVRGMGSKGSMVRQQAFKALKGGKNMLNADLLDNTLMNWAHLLDAAAKNRAAKATLEAAVNLGVAVESDQETVKQMGKSAKTAPVWFMDSGKQRHFIVEDPMLLTAISSLEYAGMRNPVMNAMSAMKHVLTVGVTASPFFKIRNLIRDSVQAIGVSPLGANPLANVAQGWKLTDPKSDAYFRLLAGGGTIHFGAMLEGSESKRIQKLVEEGVDRSTILDDENAVKAFYRKVISPMVNAYQSVGNRGESINRAALYDQLVKQGMGHAQASLQARDMMDFSMAGSFTSVRFLTQAVPFLNARLQGLYKLGVAAKEDPKRMAAVTGAVAMASVALLAAYGDDDDWKKREDYDRNNFWWFKVGGVAYRIPKPFELGAIGTLAERGFEFMFDKEMTGKRLRSQVLTLLSDNLAMNPIPQAFKPLLDVYANKDGLSGRPIETPSMEKLRPEYRFNDRTSMTARAISTGLNSATQLIGKDAISPVMVDSMLRGYFGWLGSFVIGSADVLARPATNQPVQASADMWKMATGNIISDLRDAPSRYVSTMYEQAKELEQAHGTWRMLVKEGKTAEAAEFRTSNAEQLGRYSGVEAIKQAAAKLNTQRREVERSSLDADAKREALRRISLQQERIAKQLKIPG